MSKIFKFGEQLKIGDRGEAAFKKRFHMFNPVKSKDLRWDFNVSIGDKVKRVEIKTDNYKLEDTAFMFMERFSDLKNPNKKGGPWRAYEDKVDVFVYYHIQDDAWFIFKDLKQLVDSINWYIEYQSPRKVCINNGHYAVEGFLIPRTYLTSKNIWSDGSTCVL